MLRARTVCSLIPTLAWLAAAPLPAQRRDSARDTATVPLELVAALLGSMGADSPPELRVGALASGIQTDLVPPGARILGSLSYQREAAYQGNSVVAAGRGPGTVILVVNGFPEDAVATYMRYLDQQGWRTPASFGPRDGGFVSVPVTRPSFVCRDSSHVTVSASSREAGGSHLRLQITPITPHYDPCDAPRRYASAVRRSSMMDELALPPLYPPAGAQTLGPGGTSGGDPGGVMYRELSVRLETPHTPAELVNHYARQLEAAGWKSESRRLTDRLMAIQVFTTADSSGRTMRGVLTASMLPGINPLLRDVAVRVTRVAR